MALIRRVEVRGFRSLADVALPELGDLVALVGKNSSGKSNVLRALNLFFNNEPQPGQSVSFTRDLFERPARRQKKGFSVSVTFALPKSFRFRKQQDYLQALGTEFTITRSWELDHRREVVNRYEVDVGGKPPANAPALAGGFLSLIAFRYIPNRTVPAEILRTESQGLAGSIFLRMKDQSHADALLAGLIDAAARMLKGASDALATTGSPLSEPAVATTGLADMLLMSGFRARGAHGGLVQDADWGAGHQAFFLYQVLLALDTDYSRFFGWRQATIWAVEEPESALHRELETRLAARFREWTKDPGYRLQVLLTTHSPVFAMAADTGAWVYLDGASTSLKPLPIAQLARSAETEGVTSWTHPVLTHPWNPVVLVEGATDADALTHVAGLAGASQLRFLPLPELDDNERGAGKDAMIQYLKRHHQLVHNRQREAPLIALFDWETSDQDMAKARAAYGPGAADHVVRMDPTNCDTQMGPDFRGIERFYPPRVVLEAHETGELVLGIAAGKPYSIAKSQLMPAKRALVRRLLSTTDPVELAPLAKVLRAVEAAVASGVLSQRDLFDHATP